MLACTLNHSCPLQNQEYFHLVTVTQRPKLSSSVYSPKVAQWLRARFSVASNSLTMASSTPPRLGQYAAYLDPNTGRPRIGHLDLTLKTIEPLCFTSGTPVANLYQVIEAGPSKIISDGDPISVSRVRLLPPISGRDVLAVGKNYMEHAKEFNGSGYDSSDKVDRPSHPVIFTKRATSIIADGEDIYPHEGFSDTVDYEGEIGVIIGRPGFRIDEGNAWSHVWGYTIINDITARERQRDHKQFFIGKSADTFCPMVRTLILTFGKAST
jgi:hypothetical protein